MAIIQISKIQQRSGNLVDLPQLDEAQFGWATDAKRLFIGKTAPNENIEVLTSYSNISFSQIDGSDGGNFNINGATNGQTLTYVALTNTWENWTGNASQLGNAKLQLGDVSNISILGGATGYVLETDGVGNLAWTSKGTLRSPILALANTNPVVMTVANTTPYTNGLAVTVSGVDATNANTVINGQTFYVQVAVDFPTSGNVELYTDPGLTTTLDGTSLGAYTYNPSNPAIATALISGSGSSNAGGSVNTIQFNNGGVLDGSANFTITGGNLVTLNGNLSASNVSGGNLVTANYFAGVLTTSAQPNITSTGTLASLSVSGNSNVGNINVTGNILPTANVTYNLGSATNAFKDLYLSGTSIKLGTQTITSNSNGVILSNVAYASNLSATGNISASYFLGNGSQLTSVSATSTPAANLTGSTLSSNVVSSSLTALGTLASLSVSGNANIGNIGTSGLITATGNITTSANIVGTHYGAATGLTSIPGGNVSGQVGNALVAGTVYTNAQPNITSTGTLASLSVSGNANIGNIGTAGLITATGNVTAGNLVTAGVVSASGNATVLGIKTDNYYYANGVAISFAGAYSNSNVASYLPTYTGTVGATALTTGANTTVGTITGNWSLSAGSRLNATYADLAEYYEADQYYEPGTVLEFGGEKEVTIAEDGTTRVAGVVSTDPAYAMNAKCPGEHPVAIALQGRVPCKVRGKVRKGDIMVSAGNGFARPWQNAQIGMVIGKAIENFEGVEGVIEIAVGRL